MFDADQISQCHDYKITIQYMGMKKHEHGGVVCLPISDLSHRPTVINSLKCNRVTHQYPDTSISMHLYLLNGRNSSLRFYTKRYSSQLYYMR